MVTILFQNLVSKWLAKCTLHRDSGVTSLNMWNFDKRRATSGILSVWVASVAGTIVPSEAGEICPEEAMRHCDNRVPKALSQEPQFPDIRTIALTAVSSSTASSTVSSSF